ncbi:hypothetical protein AB0395_20025 [Streptosporangium sp. NPDC051023]|uniref:hypothetical protein n=1 Tax=Streptosporangium sp. NPDC051023 TaxID=3155410 RepID=UPI003450CD76
MPRAIVFATLCTAVSAGGHVLAGGALVPPRLGILGAVIAFCVAYPLGGRERGPEVVLGATTGVQILLHELFNRAASGPHATGLGEHGHPGSGMTAVHLAVALGTGWWLYRGESAVWLMIRLHGGRVPAIRLLLVIPAEVSAPVWQAVPAADAAPYGGLEILPSIRRRGPPPLPRHTG